MLAAAGGANVVVFDKRQDRLAQMMRLGTNVTALYPYEEYVARELRTADLVVGAVLVPSARAPRVVTAAMVKDMEPGSVLADISIDQGGCFETSKPHHLEGPDLRGRWRDPLLPSPTCRVRCRRPARRRSPRRSCRG
jgi:alanine dehydrogenase